MHIDFNGLRLKVTLKPKSKHANNYPKLKMKLWSFIPCISSLDGSSATTAKMRTTPNKQHKRMGLRLIFVSAHYVT